MLPFRGMKGIFTCDMAKAEVELAKTILKEFVHD